MPHEGGVLVFAWVATEKLKGAGEPKIRELRAVSVAVAGLSKEEAGAAYVKRVYPNKPNLVKVVKDQKVAEEYLRNEWQEMLKKPPFSGYDYIAGTQKVTLTPKKGETVLDKISDLPPRKRP